LVSCSNAAYLRRSQVEPGLIAGIRQELTAPEIVEELQRRVRQRLKKQSAAAPDQGALHLLTAGAFPRR
jgi:hypothetical protein